MTATASNLLSRFAATGLAGISATYIAHTIATKTEEIRHPSRRVGTPAPASRVDQLQTNIEQMRAPPKKIRSTVLPNMHTPRRLNVPHPLPTLTLTPNPMHELARPARVDQQVLAKRSRDLACTLQKESLTLMQSAFRLGMPRALALAQTRTQLTNTYQQQFQALGWSSDKILSEINKACQAFPDFIVSPQGGRLSKTKGDTFSDEPSLLRHTTIRDSKGRNHSLLTTVYPDEASALTRGGFYVGAGKLALGAGTFGVVRLARDENNCFEAVKKLSHLNGDTDADHEVAILKKITKGEHLIRYRGSAKIPLTSELSKSYIFMDLAGQIDGIDAAQLRAERAKAPGFDLDLYNHLIGQQYVKSVAELHDLGIYHCDLKLDNFTHRLDNTRERVKLIDYGAATEDEFEPVPTATHGFIAPECWALFHSREACADMQSHMPPDTAACLTGSEIKNHRHSNAKRDSWALGIVLLSWRAGEDTPFCGELSLTVRDDNTGDTHRLPLKFHNGECLGTHDSDRWAGATWDEVIAKLLDIDPVKRPTPREVLNLPLFTA